MGEAGRLENATMVVGDGKISEIGTDIKIPDDARLVSLAGKTIMPGIVDPYFVFKKTAVSSTRTVTFRGRTFTLPGGGPFSAGPFTRIGEYFDPFDFNLLGLGFVGQGECGYEGETQAVCEDGFWSHEFFLSVGVWES